MVDVPDFILFPFGRILSFGRPPLGTVPQWYPRRFYQSGRGTY